MAASRTQNPPPTGPSPLKGANVLILDESAPVAAALRAQLEDRGATYVEVATTADEALDVLGRAARPVLLTMMDTFSGNAACKDVLRVLREHRRQQRGGATLGRILEQRTALVSDDRLRQSQCRVQSNERNPSQRSTSISFPLGFNKRRQPIAKCSSTGPCGGIIVCAIIAEIGQGSLR